eukprot:3074837-Pleurochrysis_carterae.AAC.2
MKKTICRRGHAPEAVEHNQTRKHELYRGAQTRVKTVRIARKDLKSLECLCSLARYTLTCSS